MKTQYIQLWITIYIFGKLLSYDFKKQNWHIVYKHNNLKGPNYVATYKK